MRRRRLFRASGFALVVAGALWTVAPLATMLVDDPLINVAYVLPLALLLGGVVGLWQYTGNGPVGDLGYVLTLAGVVLAGTGSLLAATLSLGAQDALGVDAPLVFFAGFYLLLVGALFLGIGLWRDGSLSSVGPVLLALTLPVALVGFRVLNSGGLADVNWIPFTVPYGAAWVTLGYDLGSRSSATPEAE